MDDKKTTPVSFNSLKALHAASDFRESEIIFLLHNVFQGCSTSQVSGFSVSFLQRWRLVCSFSLKPVNFFGLYTFS